MSVPPDTPNPVRYGETDHLLDGRIALRQPQAGYRAAMDSVLLGAAVQAPAGTRVLELGCGAGAALLVAAQWNRDAYFDAVEIDPALAQLAQDNAAANDLGQRVSVVTADVRAIAAARRDSYDVVFFNPPYLDDPAALRSPQDPARARAFVAGAAGTDLQGWITAALAVLKTRGWLVLIHRADRVDDVVSALKPSAGALRLLPVSPRADAPATRVLVAARKGAKTPVTLLPPLVLFDDDHVESAASRAILSGRARTPLMA